MIHRHHRQRRSQGGSDDPPNVIEIPDALHEWIHNNVEEARKLGLLVPGYLDPSEVMIQIPEKFIRVAKERKADPEKPRQKVTVTIKVPKDEREDGAEVLQTLIDECRKELAEPMGWQDDVPAYFVVSAVLADWLSGRG